LWNISDRKQRSEQAGTRRTNTGQSGLDRVSHTDNLDFSTLGDGSSLDLSGSDGSSTRDGEDILDIHQERLVEVTY
jgi:hypothetical protein